LREEIIRLMDLQVIDRQLQELELALTSIAGRVDQIRDETHKNQSELDRLSEQDKEISAARKKAERELAEGEVRIRNKRMRLTLVRNDKELQALTHEVDSLKETNQRLESEILTSMEGADTRTARIKELTEAIAKGRVELAAAEKEIAVQVEEFKADIAKHRKAREKVAENIEPSLLARYQMIFSRRGGVAVTMAKGGTCQGCRMRLPPQLYNEIQKHLQIHFCPNCQRILYYEDQPEKPPSS
jgi:predicted  nucleic acid-binding Zn-ribbon protein